MSQRPSANQGGKKAQPKHGFVERFFRVTTTRNAAFISKLFAMVDDESTQDLIAWTSSGDQFTVFNNTEFSRVVLPRYFKHCNWSSFVRQLNMYDFHKVNDNSNDEETTSNDNQTQRWDFKHPCFNRAGFDRLHKIRRKPPRNRLIPQIRYSSAMDIIPSMSPEYEAPPPVESSGHVSPTNSNVSSNPAIQETLSQLQDTTGNLESKLDYTANEVQYLKIIIENQQGVLNELLASVEYLKSEQASCNDTSPTTETRKPRKIHELLGSNTEPQNIEYNQYQIEEEAPDKRRKRHSAQKYDT